MSYIENQININSGAVGNHQDKMGLVLENINITQDNLKEILSYNNLQNLKNSSVEDINDSVETHIYQTNQMNQDLEALRDDPLRYLMDVLEEHVSLKTQEITDMKDEFEVLTDDMLNAQEDMAVLYATCMSWGLPQDDSWGGDISGLDSWQRLDEQFNIEQELNIDPHDVNYSQLNSIQTYVDSQINIMQNELDKMTSEMSAELELLTAAKDNLSNLSQSLVSLSKTL